MKLKFKKIRRGLVVCEGTRHVYSAMRIDGGDEHVGFGRCWCDSPAGHALAYRWEIVEEYRRLP